MTPCDDCGELFEEEELHSYDMSLYCLDCYEDRVCAEEETTKDMEEEG